MKLLVITKEEGPENREALEMAENLSKEGYDVDTLDWEAEESVTVSQLYDIYSTPAFIITTNDGSLVEMWQGSQQPISSEIKHLM